MTPSPHIELASSGRTIVISLHGTLDATGVRLLVAGVDAAVAGEWERVSVDFGAVELVTKEGAAAFATVLSRYRGAADRLVYEAATKAGQAALLAAYDR